MHHKLLLKKLFFLFIFSVSQSNKAMHKLPTAALCLTASVALDFCCDYLSHLTPEPETYHEKIKPSSPEQIASEVGQKILNKASIGIFCYAFTNPKQEFNFKFHLGIKLCDLVIKHWGTKPMLAEMEAERLKDLSDADSNESKRIDDFITTNQAKYKEIKKKHLDKTIANATLDDKELDTYCERKTREELSQTNPPLNDTRLLKGPEFVDLLASSMIAVNTIETSLAQETCPFIIANPFNTIVSNGLLHWPTRTLNLMSINYIVHCLSPKTDQFFNPTLYAYAMLRQFELVRPFPVITHFCPLLNIVSPEKTVQGLLLFFAITTLGNLANRLFVHIFLIKPSEKLNNTIIGPIYEKLKKSFSGIKQATDSTTEQTFAQKFVSDLCNKIPYLISTTIVLCFFDFIFKTLAKRGFIPAHS